ncbi:MAG: hypothetical protein JOZ58_24220 [Acetobacteraceae bacterium]|nr:hypothetical protein [Acetobacteraceae bacterium]
MNTLFLDAGAANRRRWKPDLQIRSECNLCAISKAGQPEHCRMGVVSAKALMGAGRRTLSAPDGVQ